MAPDCEKGPQTLFEGLFYRLLHSAAKKRNRHQQNGKHTYDRKQYDHARRHGAASASFWGFFLLRHRFLRSFPKILFLFYPICRTLSSGKNIFRND